MPRYTRKQRGGGVNKPTPTCQCLNPATGRGCTASAVHGSVFCQEHQGCPMSPRSGAEPKYEPEKYNSDPAIYKSHNCYSYSMNVVDPKSIAGCRKNNNADCRGFFHQPGALSGQRNALIDNAAVDRLSCPVVEKLAMTDVPGMEKSSFYGKCPQGKSKVYLVVSNGDIKTKDEKNKQTKNGKDYHWYRLDSNGMWSHKDGSNKVKNFDALKQPIFNPELTSRDYRWQGSDLNYKHSCGFYCAPRDQPVVLGQGGALKGAGLSWRDHQRLQRQRRQQQRRTRRIAKRRA